MSGTKVKVAVRVRPMNRRGEPALAILSGEGSARTCPVVWVRVSVLVLWVYRVCQHIHSYTHNTDSHLHTRVWV